MYMKRSKHVLIDGDIILYAAGFAAQRKVYHVADKTFDDRSLAEAYAGTNGIDEEETVAEPIENVLFTVKKMLTHIKEGAKADSYEVVISGDSNFRERVATIQPYKGNREDNAKPLHYDNIKEYLIDVQHAIVTEDEEADDYMGYTSTEFGFTIATLDKDLDNVPGWHYNWKRDELYYVDEDEALLNFYMQMLTGDATDHIPGLFKLTGKKALAKVKLPLHELTSAKEMYAYVLGVWTDALDGTEADAADILAEIGQLLWIRHEEGETWTPPT